MHLGSLTAQTVTHYEGPEGGVPAYDYPLNCFCKSKTVLKTKSIKNNILSSIVTYGGSGEA